MDLDAAYSVRWAKPASELLTLDPDRLDLQILVLIASMRHLLSSQIHRRFNAGRAVTTTQRRLKRLSDAGLVARFQFHRRDGGGVPMCYSLTASGLRLSREHGHLLAHEIVGGAGPHENDPSPSLSPFPSKSSADDQLLRQARRDVRVAGWALAVEKTLPGGLLELRGADESAISPPARFKGGSQARMTPADLRLPGGRTPHDFLRTADRGARVEVERFHSIRPAVALRTKQNELLIEFDDRLPEGIGAAKLERYDHFLAGWSVHLARYRRCGDLPTVVFVCRDSSRARECARRADQVLTACRAYAGEYPSDWEYPGRDRIVYVAERDAHEGVLYGWVPPSLPPDVRVAAGGDPRRRDPIIRLYDLATKSFRSLA